jgi:RimJ/RimL family protein N-acetyltransferase
MIIETPTADELVDFFSDEEIKYFSFFDYNEEMDKKTAEDILKRMIVLSVKDNSIIAIAVVEKFYFNLGRVHYAVRKDQRKKGSEIAKIIIKKLFNEYGFKKLIAHIPSFNKRARHFANALGFRLYNKREKACPKDGIYYDIFEYEVLSWA